MSGRGRGRGRGRRKPITVASNFVRRSAEESGLDSRNLRSLQQQKGLYPDIRFHSSGIKHAISTSDDEIPMNKKSKEISIPERKPSTVYMITKHREMHYRIQNSSFYLKSESNLPDVLRYQKNNDKSSKGILHDCFQEGKINTNLGSFFPDELFSCATGLEKKKKIIKEEYEEKKVDDEDAEEEELEENEEEEEGEDYVQDYYASDNDESVDGNEPTF